MGELEKNLESGSTLNTKKGEGDAAIMNLFKQKWGSYLEPFQETQKKPCFISIELCCNYLCLIRLHCSSLWPVTSSSPVVLVLLRGTEQLLDVLGDLLRLTDDILSAGERWVRFCPQVIQLRDGAALPQPATAPQPPTSTRG